MGASDPRSAFVTTALLLATGVAIVLLATTSARTDYLTNPPQIPNPQLLTLEPSSIATDQRGRLIAGLIIPNSGVAVSTSQNDGRSWTNPVQLALAPGTYSDLSVCMNTSGSAYSIYRYAPDPTMPGEIHFNWFRFSDASSDYVPTDDALRLDLGLEATDSIRPILRCNDNGDASVIWQEQTQPGGGRDLFGAALSVQGQAVSHLRRLSADGSSDIVDHDLDLHRSGESWATWQAAGSGGWTIDVAAFDRDRMRVLPLPTAQPGVPHNATDPLIRVFSREGSGPGAPPLKVVAVAFLSDADGRPRASTIFSLDGGATFSPVTTPDGTTCPGGQSQPRLCLGSVGMVAGFVCDGATEAGFANSSLDFGMNWDRPSAVSIDRGDGQTDNPPPWDLRCNQGPLPGVHAGFGTYLIGRQHSLGYRLGDTGVFEFNPKTQPLEGMPPQSGSRMFLTSDESDRAWVAIDFTQQGSVAVNGTTGQFRVDPDSSTDPGKFSMVHADHPNVAVGWREESSTDPVIRVASSPDGGGFWLPPIDVFSGRVSDPMLLSTEATDASGHAAMMLVVADAGSEAAPRTRLRSAVSQNHGGAWSLFDGPPAMPIESGKFETTGMGAVMGGSARFYTAWIADGSTDPGTSQVRLSTFSNDVWSPDVRLDNSGAIPGAATGRPLLACDALGIVCVFWEDQRDPGDMQLRVNCSLDGGQTWQPAATRLDEPNGNISRDMDLATDGSGHYAVVWRETSGTGQEFAAYSHSCGGGAWSPPVAVPPAPFPGNVNAPQVTMLSDGHVLIAYDDGQNVYANVSSNWGNTWRPQSFLVASCAGPGGSTGDCGEGVRLLATPDGGASIAFQHPNAQGIRTLSVITADDFGLGMHWSAPYDLAPNIATPADAVGKLALVHQELHRPPTALMVWGTFSAAPGMRESISANNWRMPSGVPLEMKGLRANAALDLLWEPFDFPSGAATAYNLYRAPVSGSGSGTAGARFNCLSRQQTPTMFHDAMTPPPGGLFLYQVTGMGPAGEGPSGTTLQLISCEPRPPTCF